MPNIRAIAKKAGVSISTVSRVLNNQTGVSDSSRKAVLDTVNSAGYVPEIGRKSTSNIAIVYTGRATLESPFDSALIAGVYAGLENSDADLLILDAQRSRRPGESVTQMLMRKGAQGALLRTTTERQGLCQEVMAEGFPAVIVGFRPEGKSAHYAYSDSRSTSRDAVEHLLSLGHRTIAIGIHSVEDSDHADRVAGYREALQAYGISFDDRLVLRATADREGGIQIVRRILSSLQRPTAVFLADPHQAIGAFEEARRQKIQIPADLSVVGFDDGELRYTLSPSITAVCQDTIALGRRAVALLRQVIAQPKNAKPLHETLPCRLEIHESTAPPASFSDSKNSHVRGRRRAGE